MITFKAGVGVGDGLGEGDGLGLGDGDGEIDGDGLGDTDGVGVGEPFGVGGLLRFWGSLVINWKSLKLSLVSCVLPLGPPGFRS